MLLIYYAISSLYEGFFFAMQILIFRKILALCRVYNSVTLANFDRETRQNRCFFDQNSKALCR